MDHTTHKPNEEIDLRAITTALMRQWPWMLFGTCTGLATTVLLLMKSTPVWEGEFQIVLSEGESTIGSSLSSLAGGNQLLSSLAGLGATQGGQLETEVKILESPSVLKPIYEQIKARKDNENEPDTGWDYQDFAGNLDIKLEKGTSILNVTYRDSDKSVILPVLNSISKAYQAYSGLERSESLQRGLVFLDHQLKHWRIQAAASSRALDTFRLKYGISPGGSGITGSGGVDISKLLNASTNIQGAGINLDTSSAGSNEMSPIGDPLGSLAAINQELIRRRMEFRDNDPSIIALIKERDAVRNYIAISAGGNLALPGYKPRNSAEAHSIVLRYQELNRASKRDSSTLNSLENSLLSLQLEQARTPKHWKLISTPTLQESPVSPKAGRALLLGFLGGIVLGGGLSLLAEHSSGRVFTNEELSKHLQLKLLATLRVRNPEQVVTNLTLISQGILSGCLNLAIIPIGLPESDPALLYIRDVLKKLLPASSIDLITNLSEASDCSHQLLVTSLGATTRRQLNDIQQQLELQSQSPCGWILLDYNDAS